MNTQEYVFTSESVSHGHPDKIADQISDALLDYCLSCNPDARSAIEVLVKSDTVVIAGEIANVSLTNNVVVEIVRDVIKNIGYDFGVFNWHDVKIITLLNQQSNEIACGVDNRDIQNEGAGDQGIMFGYATNETDCFMPATIYYAHKVLRSIFDAMNLEKIPRLGPDAKSQVSLCYVNGIPVSVHTIVVSIQHSENMNLTLRTIFPISFTKPYWLFFKNLTDFYFYFFFSNRLTNSYNFSPKIFYHITNIYDRILSVFNRF